MQVSIIGIDLAKNVFQVCALSDRRKVRFNRQVTRARLPALMAQQPATRVVMEATASAHYWGRVFRRMGHQVELLPPQHVRAFRRIHKSDPHDALSICEAADRPNLHPVPIKSIPGQDMQLVERCRQRLIRQRTQTLNQIRGFAREYGVFFAKGKQPVYRELPAALESTDNELSAIAREILWDLYQEARHLDQRIAQLKARLLELTAPLASYQRLRELPGFGPVVASAMAAAGIDGNRFRNGRHCAAWLGLVPRQHSSGEREQRRGITKNGDRHLRTLLIHGARTVVRWAIARERDDALGRWVRRLVDRRGYNRAIVALANKLARVAWAVVNHDEPFNVNKAFSG